MIHDNAILILMKLLIIFVFKFPLIKSYRCNLNKCSCDGLAYIPKFPVNTTSVEIKNPTFSKLYFNTVLNLSSIHLKELSFIGCEFSNSSNYVFSSLHYMKVLNFQICKLNHNVLRQMFSSISLINVTSLSFDGVNKKEWSFNFINGIKANNILYFRVIRTTIAIFNGSDLVYLSRLRTLDLSFNKISTIISWGRHYFLKTLYLYNNPILRIPHFIDEIGMLCFPTLLSMNLSLYHWNFLGEGSFKGLQKMISLSLYIPDLVLIKPNLFRGLKGLLTFSLISKSKTVSVGEYVFASKTLRSLTLKNMVIDVSKSHPNGIFNTNNNISFLKLKFVSFIGNISMNSILKVLTNLEYLEVSNNALSSIPECVCDMKKIHTLIFSRTKVRTWKTKNCLVMYNLTKLSLSHNNIFNVNNSSFSKALRYNKKLTWDISYNNYICDCRILWFRDWMNENSGRILNYPKSYLCNSPPFLKNLQISKYYVSLEYCLNIKMPSPFAISGVVLGVFSVIFTIMGIVSYIKRWSIRYWVHLLYSRRKRYKLLKNTGIYNYDAFVCYCGSDIRWVTNYLLPILEEENHFHICLHDRDFVVGNDIIDNIVDSIQQSRKVVLVLSANFAKSQWCQFETSLAQQRLFEEKKDIVVPILLENIPNELQTRRLALLLKRKTYLEWSDEYYGQMMFWERLINILHGEDIYEI